jgi:hypothetical protein
MGSWFKAQMMTHACGCSYLLAVCPQAGWEGGVWIFLISWQALQYGGLPPSSGDRPCTLQGGSYLPVAAWAGACICPPAVCFWALCLCDTGSAH